MKIKKKYFLCLPTDSMEDFRSIEGNEDVEMFEGNGIDINDFIVSGYLPTKELLDRVNGEDWY